MEGRDFLSFLAAIPVALEASASSAAAQPEIENYWIEVPAGATLWALTVFLGDDAIEFSVGAGKDVRTARGRYDGERLNEVSWRNKGTATERVAVEHLGDPRRTAEVAANLTRWVGVRPLPSGSAWIPRP
jgi:hypothetical protein